MRCVWTHAGMQHGKSKRLGVAMSRKKLRKTCVLVVDDVATIRRMVKGVLEPAGYEVIDAEDAITALSLIHERQPDLMLLDIHFPNGPSGLEIINLVGETPVMIMTADRSDELFDDIKRTHVITHMAKPLEAFSLVRHVQMALKNAEARKHITIAMRETREIACAIGIIMGVLHTRQAGAFKALQQASIQQKKSVKALAKVILAEFETLGSEGSHAERGQRLGAMLQGTQANERSI